MSSDVLILVGAFFFIVISFVVISYCFKLCCPSCTPNESQDELTANSPACNQRQQPSARTQRSNLLATSLQNNKNYITTIDVQTGLPVVVDIAAIVTQLSHDRIAQSSMGDHFMDGLPRSANYGSINYHGPVIPMAPPPAYSEVYPEQRT